MNSNISLASGDGRANRLRRGSGLAAIVVCVAAFATACGGPGGSADPGSGGSGNGVRFAECMRTHGLPNFPDPSGSGVNLSGINQKSPQYQHAAGICGRPAGAGAAQQAQAVAKALEFSRCMRAHGVLNYSDPTVSNSGNGSSITSHMSSGSGVDRKSPVFQAALRACRSVWPGGPRWQHSGGSAG